MRISEAARETGLSISNIRFYEKKGLLEPERKNESQYRDYNAADIQRLRLIILYRKMDLSLENIMDLLEEKVSLDELLSHQIDQLNEKKAMIEGSIHLCESVKKCPALNCEDVEYYLTYIKTEEEKGIRFGGIEDFLDNYASSFRYESLFVSAVSKVPILMKKEHILRCLWTAINLLIPMILFVSMILDTEGLTLVRGIFLIGFALCLWPPAIKAYLQ